MPGFQANRQLEPGQITALRGGPLCPSLEGRGDDGFPCKVCSLKRIDRKATVGIGERTMERKWPAE